MRRQSILVIVMLTVVIVVPIVYSLHLHDSKQFWDNAMGNLLATAIALIGGIPIALWMNRRAVAVEKRKEDRIKREQEKELVSLLINELSSNLKDTKERMANVPNGFHTFPLKLDLWDASASSGNLELISDRKVLDKLASAYYLVRHVCNIEDQVRRSGRSATVTFGQKTATQLLYEDAVFCYDPLKEALSNAIDALNAHEISLTSALSSV